MVIQELQSRVVESYEEQLGASHLETLRAKSDLAELFEASDELRRAEELQRHVFEERKRVLGEQNLETTLNLKEAKSRTHSKDKHIYDHII